MEKTIRTFGRSELAQPDLAHVSMAQVPGVACP